MLNFSLPTDWFNLRYVGEAVGYCDTRPCIILQSHGGGLAPCRRFGRERGFGIEHPRKMCTGIRGSSPIVTRAQRNVLASALELGQRVTDSQHPDATIQIRRTILCVTESRPTVALSVACQSGGSGTTLHNYNSI